MSPPGTEPTKERSEWRACHRTGQGKTRQSEYRRVSRQREDQKPQAGASRENRMLSAQKETGT